MDILIVKQLDTDKVKDLVYGLENFEKDKAVRAGLYAGGSILKRGGVMRLKLRMKSPYGHKGNLIKATTAVVIGSVIYKACVAIAIEVGLPATDLKMITAVLFLIILIISMDRKKKVKKA